MSNKLILVKNSDGQSKNILLDVASMLSAVRTLLTTDGIMGASDDFIVNDAPVQGTDEPSIALSDALSHNGQELDLGHPTGPTPSHTDWSQLNPTDQLAIFTRMGIYRGITADPTNGFTRCFDQVIVPFSTRNLPPSNSLGSNATNTRVSTSYSFSKLVQDFSTNNTQSGSVGLTTPYGGGNASFKYAQSHSTSSTEVKTYYLGKYLLMQAEVMMDPKKLQLTQDFVNAITTAISSGSDATQMFALLTAFNKYGWYIPTKFIIGGALVTTADTTVSSFTEVDTKETDFSAGFEAAFDGIGGSASYSNADKSTASTASTHKMAVSNFTQIGGLVGSANTPDTGYSKWSESIQASSNNWAVASYEEMTPTLALFNDSDLHIQMRNYILKLMQNNLANPVIAQLQEVIDLGKYCTQVEVLVSNGIA